MFVVGVGLLYLWFKHFNFELGEYVLTKLQNIVFVKNYTLTFGFTLRSHFFAPWVSISFNPPLTHLQNTICNNRKLFSDNEDAIENRKNYDYYRYRISAAFSWLRVLLLAFYFLLFRYDFRDTDWLFSAKHWYPQGTTLRGIILKDIYY